MKRIIINYRSSHHSDYSGYDRLTDYLIEPIKIPSNTSERIIPYRLSKFIGSIHDKNKGEFNSESVIKEIELYRLLKKNKKEKKIIHYLNAEHDIRHVVNRKRYFEKTSFIGTFHKPNDILKCQIPNPKYLKKLDGAICVGPNQVEFLKNWLENDNIKFIPHGIDTNFFQSNFNKREENTLLFVGQHLRDFDTFNYSIPRIVEKIPKLKINVILHKSYQKYIDHHKAITVFNRINDIELKKHYQKASALFLPLLDCTACNSILEAMAMGLPIITTDVGGNYGYVNNNNAILVPKNDNDYLINATIELLKNEEKINKMSLASLEKSKQFDWTLIANQVNEYYKSCILNL